MNTQQQSEELWADLQPAGGRTPFLYLRVDSAGDLVLTNSPSSLRLREETVGGDLISSDDTAKAAGTLALVSGPAILAYKV
jgi:hypothetical protein